MARDSSLHVSGFHDDRGICFETEVVDGGVIAGVRSQSAESDFGNRDRLVPIITLVRCGC